MARHPLARQTRFGSLKPGDRVWWGERWQWVTTIVQSGRTAGGIGFVALELNKSGFVSSASDRLVFRQQKEHTKKAAKA